MPLLPLLSSAPSFSSLSPSSFPEEKKDAANAGEYLELTVLWFGRMQAFPVGTHVPGVSSSPVLQTNLGAESAPAVFESGGSLWLPEPCPNTAGTQYSFSKLPDSSCPGSSARISWRVSHGPSFILNRLCFGSNNISS